MLDIAMDERWPQFFLRKEALMTLARLSSQRRYSIQDVRHRKRRRRVIRTPCSARGSAGVSSLNAPDRTLQKLVDLAALTRFHLLQDGRQFPVRVTNCRTGNALPMACCVA